MSKGLYGLERRSAVRVRRMRQLRTAASLVALLVIVLGYLVVQGVRAERDRSSQQATTEEPDSDFQVSLDSRLAPEQKLAAETPSSTEAHSPKDGGVPDALADASPLAFASPQTAMPSVDAALPSLPENTPVSQQALNSVEGGGIGGHGMRGAAPSMYGSGGGGGGVGGGSGAGNAGGSKSGDTATGSATGRPTVLGKKFSNGSDESNDAAPSANGGSNGANGSNGSNDRNGDGNGNNGSNGAGSGGNGVSNDRNGDGNGNNGKNADNASNGGNGSNGGGHDGNSTDAGDPPPNAGGINSLVFNEQPLNVGDTAGSNDIDGDVPSVPEPGSILFGIGAIAVLARRRAR